MCYRRPASGKFSGVLNEQQPGKGELELELEDAQAAEPPEHKKTKDQARKPWFKRRGLEQSNVGFSPLLCKPFLEFTYSHGWCSLSS